LSGEVTSWQEPLSLGIDQDDNIVLGGYFSGSIDFDPGIGEYNVTSHTPERDGFVVKFDQEGNFEWFDHIGGEATDATQQISVDNENNIIAIGHFRLLANLDGTPLTFESSSHSGSTDIFVKKLSSEGDLIWLNTYGGPTTEFAWACDVNEFNEPIIGGQFGSTVNFNPGGDDDYRDAIGFHDIFIQKLSPEGEPIWTECIDADESFGFASAYDIFIENSNTIYVCGIFNRTVDFDFGPEIYDLSSNGIGQDFFLMQIKSSSDIGLPANFINEKYIYPNPSKGIVKIEWEEKIEKLKIFNAQGKLIHSNNLNNQSTYQIDLSAYPPGLYYVQSETKSGTNLNQKLILCD
jgi:hypothetical protein